jgi:hypothetical protein
MSDPECQQCRGPVSVSGPHHTVPNNAGEDCGGDHMRGGQRERGVKYSSGAKVLITLSE